MPHPQSMSSAIQSCLGRTGYYEKRGTDAVLLVHGLSGTPAEMRYFARRLLKQGFSVMCPQLAGHCGSVRELRRSRWRDWYGTIERSFEALKAEHAAVFVSGLSMGALIALRLAAEKGERVDGIGLLSTTFYYDGWNMPRLRQRFLLPLVLYSPLRYFVSWEETPPYGIKCERTRAAVSAVLEQRHALTAEKFGIFSMPALTIHESKRLIKATRGVLPKVISPALIVHSVEDDMASVRNAEFTARRISSRQRETYLVDDTYHVLTLDKRKDDIARRMADFFRRCAAPAVP